jgi:hypothetical protein
LNAGIFGIEDMLKAGIFGPGIFGRGIFGPGIFGMDDMLKAGIFGPGIFGRDDMLKAGIFGPDIFGRDDRLKAGNLGRDDRLKAGNLGREEKLKAGIAGILGAGGPAAITKYPWLAISVRRFVYAVPAPPQVAYTRTGSLTVLGGGVFGA